MVFYWKLDNRYGGGAVAGWDKTNGYFYQNCNGSGDSVTEKG